MTDAAKIAKDMQDLAAPFTDSLKSVTAAAATGDQRSILVQSFTSGVRAPEVEEAGRIENKR